MYAYHEQAKIETQSNHVQVFINKSLFHASTFTYAQLSFAAYHLIISSTLLYILSRPKFNYLEAKSVPTLDILPLAIAMCMSTIIPNLSLAYSTIPFYQTIRALLPPTIAAINFFLYQAAISRNASLALIPLCLGVAIVTYYNPGAGGADSSMPDTPLGVIFAFAGVVTSAFYTVWMGVFQRRYQMNGAQLLLNQAPIGVCVLLYVVP